MRLTEQAHKYLSNLLAPLYTEDNLVYLKVDAFPTIDAGTTFEIYDLQDDEGTPEDVITNFSLPNYLILSIVVDPEKEKYFTDIVIDLKEDDNNNPIIVFYQEENE